MAAGIRDIWRFLVFIVGGIVAIIVGAFMIRGTMHMWDKPSGGRGDGQEGRRGQEGGGGAGQEGDETDGEAREGA